MKEEVEPKDDRNRRDKKIREEFEKENSGQTSRKDHSTARQKDMREKVDQKIQRAGAQKKAERRSNKRNSVRAVLRELNMITRGAEMTEKIN